MVEVLVRQVGVIRNGAVTATRTPVELNWKMARFTTIPPERIRIRGGSESKRNPPNRKTLLAVGSSFYILNISIHATKKPPVGGFF
jgi:hypothetical protein